MLRRSPLLTALLALVVGCRADAIIIDDFGTAGYALLEGTVTRHPSDPFGSGELFVSCGPGAFARSAQTDPTGAFQIELLAPGPYLPELQRLNWRVPCLIRAGVPGFVSDTVDVDFTAEHDSAAVTTVALMERAP